MNKEEKLMDNKTMDKLERIILGIGIGIGCGIFCSVIGMQLVLLNSHNSDIRKLKNEVKELRSENEAFKFCFKKLGFVIGFEESESREEK